MPVEKINSNLLVESIKSLPIILEIGEYKLYDTIRFGEFYPDLVDEYFSFMGEWGELFYNNVENRQPTPENEYFFRCLSDEIEEMLSVYEHPEWKIEFLDTAEREDIFKEFYEQYLRINDGVISLLDELHERFCLNSHSGLETIFLNLYQYDHRLDIDSLALLQKVVNDNELRKFSKSKTIKKSEMIRDEVYSDQGWKIRGFETDYLSTDKSQFRTLSKAINFYDHLDSTMKEQIAEDDGSDYNFRIVANLLPLMYYGLISEAVIADFPNIFKPSTAKLLTKLSVVNYENLVEFLKENDGEPEVKYLLAFLYAESSWKILHGESPMWAISTYLSQFLDSRLDSYMIDDILKPIRKQTKDKLFDDFG